MLRRKPLRGFFGATSAHGTAATSRFEGLSCARELTPRNTALQHGVSSSALLGGHSAVLLAFMPEGETEEGASGGGEFFLVGAN